MEDAELPPTLVVKEAVGLSRALLGGIQELVLNNQPSALLVRPKSLTPWQSNQKELAPQKALQVEEKRDSLIGGYFRAGLPRG